MFLIFQNIFFFHFESSKICTRVEKTMLNGCWITARQRWRYMKKHVCFSWLHVVHGQHVMIVCISRLEWFCARDQDQFLNSRESYKGFFALAFAFALQCCLNEYILSLRWKLPWLSKKLWLAFSDFGFEFGMVHGLTGVHELERKKKRHCEYCKLGITLGCEWMEA